MLPIVDKPTIQYVIEEAVAAGIEDILIITGRNKQAIEDHFDRSIELEKTLAEKGKSDLLGLVEDISNLVDIHYVRQKEPKGLGHAIYCARTFVRDEPFAVLLGDDIVKSEPPCLRQLVDIYNEKHGSVVGVQEVPDEDVNKYGIVKYIDGSNGTYRISDLIEKPELKDAPSNMAIMGRYVITPAIFDILGRTKPGKGGEIQLTDALNELARKEDIFAHIFKGKRFDAGDKMGYLKATIEFALEKEDLGPELRKYIKELQKKF